MAKINPLSILKKSLFAKKIGSSPGEYIYVGEKTAQVQMTLIKYNTMGEEQIELENFEHLKNSIDRRKINWINLDGVGDIELMKEISEYFNFNKLMTEDIMNSEHHPKSEKCDDHLFLTLKMVSLQHVEGQVTIIKEHISLVLGDHYVISFQDNVEGDAFNSVRQRLSTGKGLLRKSGADYLFYALTDSIVDQYFLVMEYIREQIEDIEDYILANPSENMNEKIIMLRRKILEIRRTIYMIHGAVKNILVEEFDFIHPSIRPYFKDVLDHTQHLSSNFDSFREYVTNIMEMFMSNMSNNLNIIMKTLTIFSLFFVPLTFIAGIYGMNFQYMPELAMKWGYPIILVLMLTIALVMYFYMKRKRWL